MQLETELLMLKTELNISQKDSSMAGQIITIEQHGEFSKAHSFMEKCLEKVKFGYLDKYGRQGVEALSAATPKETGLASTSWSYQINRTGDIVTLEWHNSDIENGYNVVIGCQYGHATKNGGWVEGVDFINPALRPIFESIKNDVLREVTSN